MGTEPKLEKRTYTKEEGARILAGLRRNQQNRPLAHPERSMPYHEQMVGSLKEIETYFYNRNVADLDKQFQLLGQEYRPKTQAKPTQRRLRPAPVDNYTPETPPTTRRTLDL